MNKSIKFIALLITLLFINITLSVACNGSGNSSNGEIDTSIKNWVSDQTYHWLVDENVILDKEQHIPGESERIITKQPTKYLKGEAKIVVCCTVCGYEMSSQVIELDKKDVDREEIIHTYDQEVVSEKYLKTPATENTPAVFYKSCNHGLKGEETFEVNCDYYEEKNMIISLYDTNNLTYAFNYITENKPTIPKIKYKKVSDSQYYYATVECTQFVNKYDNIEKTYYRNRCEIKLEQNTEYEYCVADLAVSQEYEIKNFTTVNLMADTYKFASFSDSQTNKDYNDFNTIGDRFNNCLSNVSEDVNFYLHTGDICEWSGNEREWELMVDANKEFFNSTPIMFTAGNHDTISKSFTNALYNHCNLNIPKQDTTNGFYYSYIYGNTKFIVLNTNVVNAKKALKDDQLNWLKTELSNKTWNWTIVSMHCPMYSVAKWGSEGATEYNAQYLALREQLVPLFAQNGVDLVIQGHDHVYSKTYPIDRKGNPISQNVDTIDGISYIVNPKGTIYIMNGTSGGNFNDPYAGFNESYYDYYKNCDKESWAEYTVTPTEIKVEVKYMDNGNVKTYKQWGIRKTMNNIDFGNIAILGDSYSTYPGYVPSGNAVWYNGSKNGIDCVDKTWWKLLADETLSNIYINESYSGSTISRSFWGSTDNNLCVSQSYTNRIKNIDLDNIDTLFIEGGTNDNDMPAYYSGQDVWGTVKYLNYSEYTKDDLKQTLPSFCYIIDYVQKTAPHVKIINVINNGLNNTITNGMIEACKHYGVDCILLENISKIDGHPNVQGMAEISQQIKKYFNINNDNLYSPYQFADTEVQIVCENQFDLSSIKIVDTDNNVYSGQRTYVVSLNNKEVAVVDGKITVNNRSLYDVKIFVDGKKVIGSYKIFGKIMQPNSQGNYEYMVMMADNTADQYMFKADYNGVVTGKLDYAGTKYGLQKAWDNGLKVWSYTFLTNGNVDYSNGVRVHFDSTIAAWTTTKCIVTLTRTNGTQEVLANDIFGNWVVDNFSFTLSANEQLKGCKITFETPDSSTMGHCFGNVLIEVENTVHTERVETTCLKEGNIEYSLLNRKYYSEENCTTEIVLADTVIAINSDNHAKDTFVYNNNDDGTQTKTHECCNAEIEKVNL